MHGAIYGVIWRKVERETYIRHCLRESVECIIRTHVFLPLLHLFSSCIAVHLRLQETSVAICKCQNFLQFRFTSQNNRRLLRIGLGLGLGLGLGRMRRSCSVCIYDASKEESTVHWIDEPAIESLSLSVGAGSIKTAPTHSSVTTANTNLPAKYLKKSSSLTIQRWFRK